MKKLKVKLCLAAAAFLAVNLWLIAKGAAKGAADFFISPTVEETILFLLLELAMIAAGCIRPLRDAKKNVIYWLVSETLVLITVFFWGIWIVGPIWFRIPCTEFNHRRF